MKKLYEDADVVINYYGFNPVIEALNNKAFVITREFGEIGEILKKIFDPKIYHVCLSNCKALKIDKSLKKQYIDEVVSSVVWYFHNFKQLRDADFKPKREITINDFAKNVFGHYCELLEEIKSS